MTGKMSDCNYRCHAEVCLVAVMVRRGNCLSNHSIHASVGGNRKIVLLNNLERKR